METPLKTGLAQISLIAQKIGVAQNLGGAAAPPARTPMTLKGVLHVPGYIVAAVVHQCRVQRSSIIFQLARISSRQFPQKLSLALWASRG